MLILKAAQGKPICQNRIWKFIKTYYLGISSPIFRKIGSKGDNCF